MENEWHLLGVSSPEVVLEDGLHLRVSILDQWGKIYWSKEGLRFNGGRTVWLPQGAFRIISSQGSVYLPHPITEGKRLAFRARMGMMLGELEVRIEDDPQ